MKMKVKDTGMIVALISTSIADEHTIYLVKDDQGKTFYKYEFELEELANPDIRAIGTPLPEVLTQVDESVGEVFPTDNRLNLNKATEEQLLAIFKGGMNKTLARRIVNKRKTLPNEKFTGFNELKSIAPRLNWEMIQQEDLVVIR